MAASTLLTLAGTTSSLPGGSQIFGPFTITSSNSNGAVDQVELQSGGNLIVLPTAPAPTGCVIVLPSNNTAVVTLKGISGDTGIKLKKTGWIMIPFDPADLIVSFIITSAATQTGKYTYIHWF